MEISDDDHNAILNEVVSLRIVPRVNPDDPSKFDIHINLGFKLQEDMGSDEGWDTIFDVALKRARISVFTGDGSCLAIDENSFGGTEVEQITLKEGKTKSRKRGKTASLAANLMKSAIGNSESKEDGNSTEFEEVTTPHRVRFWDDGGDPTWIITPIRDDYLLGNVVSTESDKLVSVINPRLGNHTMIRTNHNADPIVRIEIRCKESDWHFDNFRHVKADGSTKAIKKKFDEKSKATARTYLRRLLSGRGLGPPETDERKSPSVVAKREKMVE